AGGGQVSANLGWPATPHSGNRGLDQGLEVQEISESKDFVLSCFFQSVMCPRAIRPWMSRGKGHCRCKSPQILPLSFPLTSKLNLSIRFGNFQTVWNHLGRTEARSRRVKYHIADGGSNSYDRSFARPGGRQILSIKQNRCN